MQRPGSPAQKTVSQRDALVSEWIRDEAGPA